MKLFSEIYSTYYSITEKILKKRTVTKAEIADIIRQNGFSESVLFLEPKLTGEDGYGLLKKEDSVYKSILKKEPHIPLTALEKAWLCAVLSDPRSGLFLDTEQKSQLAELLGAKKLYQRNFLTCFDQYSDGDDFHDQQYIQHFRDILSAIHGKKLIKISFQTRKDNRITHYFLPTKIEYSAKNNKFRVYVNRYQKRRIVDSGIINLSQVTLTKLTDITPDSFLAVTNKKKQAKIKILNERNAVNRFMLEFAELEKESVFDEDSGECMVSIKYDEQNENEIIIRLLSFGPVVEVLVAEGEKESKILRAQADKESQILAAEAEKQSMILRADAVKEQKILEAEGEAQAIDMVQKAIAESIVKLNAANPNEQVIQLKSLEAFAKAADGKATKIIIPSEIQGIAGLATGLKEVMTDVKKPQ